MRLALDRPVQIVIIGAGGTGGYVIPHLYRIAYASEHPCRIILADGDVVEDKNLIRQSFSPMDIGENKAAVMAERYSNVFGINIKINPNTDYDCDKTLLRTNMSVDYQIPSYETMIKEMKEWIEGHKELYPHYKEKL